MTKLTSYYKKTWCSHRMVSPFANVLFCFWTPPSSPLPLPPQEVTVQPQTLSSRVRSWGPLQLSTVISKTSSIIDLPLYHSIFCSLLPLHLSLGCTVGSDYCRSMAEEREQGERRGEGGRRGVHLSHEAAKNPAFITITSHVGHNNTTYWDPEVQFYTYIYCHTEHIYSSSEIKHYIASTIV